MRLLLLVHNLFFFFCHITIKTKRRNKCGFRDRKILLQENSHVAFPSSLFSSYLFVCKLGLRGAFVFFCCLIRLIRPSPQRPRPGLAAPRHMAAIECHLKKKKEGSTHINASHQMSPLVKRRVTFNSNICSVSFYHTPQFTVSSFLSFFIFLSIGGTNYTLVHLYIWFHTPTNSFYRST